MKKFAIFLLFGFIIINQVFPRTCLAPNSFLEGEGSALYPDNWQSVKRVIVDIIFENDKRNAELVLSQSLYKNFYFEYIRNLSKKSSVDGIISTLIKYQEEFPDDFSVEGKRNFEALITELRASKAQGIKQIKQSLRQNYFLEKWYIRADNYLRSDLRAYTNKSQIMKISLWELPIWPIKTERKKTSNKSLGSPFLVSLDYSLVSSIKNQTYSLEEMIKNKNILQTWLTKRLKFLTNKTESNRWWKVIENGRVQSLYDLTGVKNPLEDILPASDPQKEKFKVWVADSEVYVKKQESIHKFQSLYNAIRSTYIHELEMLTEDIILYQKFIDLVFRVKDSVEMPQASLFQVNIENINAIKSLIGTTYNPKWRELKREIWGMIEVAEQLINNDFNGDKKELASLCSELLLKYNDHIKRKKEIIKKVRIGRIRALNKRACQRDLILRGKINKIKNLMDKALYAEASKQLKITARLLKNANDPEYYLIHGKLFALANELEKESVNLEESFHIVDSLQNQIKYSQYFHQLAILYVDTFIKLRLAKDVFIQDIIETTFESFIQNNPFLTANDVGERAIWWAKLNRFVRVHSSKNKSRKLFDAITRFIRIIENRLSIDDILGERNILIQKLVQTRLFVESLTVGRKFNHLIREDLWGIADALAKDYVLNDDERNIILSSILNEQRPEDITIKSSFRKAA